MSLYRLFLMRHGEAGWAKDDFSRLLTGSGRRQIKISGNWMVEKNYIPSLTLYSSSIRTQETRSYALENNAITFGSGRILDGMHP